MSKAYDPTLVQLLVTCSKDLSDQTAKLVAADCAAEQGLSNLESVLRWLASCSPHPIVNSLLFTGSRCYGTPKLESDVDWVVVCDGATRKRLIRYADEVCTGYKDKHSTVKDVGLKPDVDYPTDGRLDCAVRIGPLNLICIRTEEQWENWKEGTKQLCEIRDTIAINGGVSRDMAVRTFKSLWSSRYGQMRRDRKWQLKWSV